MRYILFLCLLSSFVSCSGTNKGDESLEGILEEGKWVIESSEFEIERFKSGIKFSKDKQVFYIDSQGRVIPTNRENVYEIKGDTLRIVDFNYEPRFLYEKGTVIGLVKHADESTIELKILHPEENTVTLTKREL